MLSSLPPARRRVVLATVGIALAGVVALLVVLVSGRTTHAKPSDQHATGPVVLVPGYGGATGGLATLAATLRARGRDAIVFQLRGDGRGDLDAQSRALGSTVDGVLTRAGAKTVDLVGYSAGGVVVRLWVREHGGAAKTRRVVTLGAPQHGTDIAALAGSLLPGACPTACRQLAPDSAVLAGLNSDDETPAGPTWVSIWTTADDVVLPPASASLAGALDFTVQSVCPGNTVTHTGLPTDRQVQAMVVAELAVGAPTKPSTCDAVSS